jgi:hypothetical protein
MREPPGADYLDSRGIIELDASIVKVSTSWAFQATPGRYARVGLFTI